MLAISGVALTKAGPTAAHLVEPILLDDMNESILLDASHTRITSRASTSNVRANNVITKRSPTGTVCIITKSVTVWARPCRLDHVWLIIVDGRRVSADAGRAAFVVTPAMGVDNPQLRG